MAMCAGVQNVSRPMVMCQEMSQRIPTTMLVEPASMAEMCQGREAGQASAIETGVAAGTIDSIGTSAIRDKPVTARNLRAERLALAALVYLDILEGISPRMLTTLPR